MNALDHPLYSSLVNPDLCRNLCHAGINTQTCFTWMKFGEPEYDLTTIAFDPDDYYNGVRRSLEIFYPDRICAFQERDMEKLLPDYYLEKTKGEYTLLCSAWFADVAFQNQRLPDLFGEVVLRALLTGILHPVFVIEKITVQ